MSNRTYQTGWEKSYKATGVEALWEQQPIPFLGKMLDTLNSHNVRSVLDVGCGEGRNLVALADAGFTAAGVDIAPTGLARAVNLVHGKSFLLEGDSVDLPFASDSIDAVTCIDVIGHVDNPRNVLDEIARVLKKDGLLIVNLFNMSDDGYGEGEDVTEYPEVHAFVFQDTIYRFFSEAGTRKLLNNWRIVRFERECWRDPPHGSFRPYPHSHDCWLVSARPPR